MEINAFSKTGNTVVFTVNAYFTGVSTAAASVYITLENGM
jgi:hypothetical protein